MELVEPIAINTKIKSKKDLKESLQILQTWFSPSFPVGSFSYSHGLEAMINDNLVKSKEDMLSFALFLAILLTIKKQLSMS